MTHTRSCSRLAAGEIARGGAVCSSLARYYLSPVCCCALVCALGTVCAGGGDREEGRGPELCVRQLSVVLDLMFLVFVLFSILFFGNRFCMGHGIFAKREVHRSVSRD